MRGDGGWGYGWYIRVHRGTAGFDVKTCHGKFFFEQSKILMHYKMIKHVARTSSEILQVLYHAVPCLAQP